MKKGGNDKGKVFPKRSLEGSSHKRRIRGRPGRSDKIREAPQAFRPCLTLRIICRFQPGVMGACVLVGPKESHQSGSVVVSFAAAWAKETRSVVVMEDSDSDEI